MPELPEVETTRRGIADLIRGLQIESVEVRRPKLRLPIPEDLAIRLEGAHWQETRRRAKFLLLDSTAGTILVHLGMSGSLRLTDPTHEYRKHDHIIWHLQGDRQLRYHDPRRFGIVTWAEVDGEPHPLIGDLGPEPIDGITTTDLAEHLWQSSRGKKKRLRDYLLDGRIIAGIGNIYANEAAWRSGIRPDRACGRVSRERYQSLAADLQHVLQVAVEKGGTTLRDFVNPEGEPGYFQHTFEVYGQEGVECSRCGREIVRDVVSQRSIFFCRGCQR